MSKRDEYVPSAAGVVSRSARSIDKFILEARDGGIGMATVNCTEGPNDLRQRTMPVAIGGSGFKLNINIAPGLTQVLKALPSPAVMEERNRLAREIHDTLAQEFAGILLHLEAAVKSDDAKWCISPECLTCARDLAKSGLEDARRMLLDLRPKALEGATLEEALRQLAERFSHDCGMACSYRSNGRARKIPVEVQDELYRVAQEALCNVRKHSRATAVSLSMHCRPGMVVLKIKDNGQGFAMVKRQAGRRGYGLPTMQERAQRLGGRIEINTAPGTGTQIIIAMPLPGKTPMERNNR